MLFLQISFFKICCSSDYERKDFFSNSFKSHITTAKGIVFKFK